MDRIRRLKWNSIWAVINTVLVMISGFVLPHLIIQYFGSNVNGLLNSINQFLQVFSFMEMGVASVAVSALYSPIAKNQQQKINEIVSSATRFYKVIGFGLLVYICALILLYPRIINTEFDSAFTTVLIIAYSASLFAQYYFGIVDACILQAYQETYVYYIVQSIASLANLLISVLLILAGQSIQIVKIVTAVIYFARPIIVRSYVVKKYHIKRNVKYKSEPIDQKWNGVAQHISFVIMNSTDVVVLTVCTTLSTVSVYSVYNMIVAALQQVFNSLLVSTKDLMGNMYAKGENTELQTFFHNFEWLVHLLVSIVYGCTVALIVPFIILYTTGVNDANYKQPFFALVITVANSWLALRLPYAELIQACGKYKETQGIFIKAALINITVSIILVFKLGLIGVAIGTLAAMGYQTISLSNFSHNNILECDIGWSIKLFVIDMIQIIIIASLYLLVPGTSMSLISWILSAMIMLGCSVGVTGIIQIVAFPKEYKRMIKQIVKKIARQ